MQVGDLSATIGDVSILPIVHFESIVNRSTDLPNLMIIVNLCVDCLQVHGDISQRLQLAMVSVQLPSTIGENS